MHETPVKMSFIAECKKFDRLDKSKGAEVYFLENFGFLTVKKYRSHKYLDIRIEVYKKAAANELRQPCIRFLMDWIIGLVR